jgi:hypothetical protein
VRTETGVRTESVTCQKASRPLSSLDDILPVTKGIALCPCSADAPLDEWIERCGDEGGARGVGTCVTFAGPFAPSAVGDSHPAFLTLAMNSEITSRYDST